ncbi:DNA methyltransferase [bacterium]|nr:DNA methyltransferase [bacterium]
MTAPQFYVLLENKGEGLKIRNKYRRQLSPFRYPGGKSRMIPRISGYLHPYYRDVLTSPFTGGGSFELAMLEANEFTRIHLNDVDYGVYGVFAESVDDPSRLVRLIENTSFDHDLFYQARESHKEGHAGKERHEAAFFSLVANRLSYSGLFTSNPLGGKNGTLEKLTARFDKSSIISRIQWIHSMRDRITVTQEDALSLIEEAYWQDGTLFVDPPYVQKGTQLYTNSYAEDDHVRLAQLLNGLNTTAGASHLIVTYDDDPLIRHLYPFADQEAVSVTYSI